MFRSLWFNIKSVYKRLKKIIFPVPFSSPSIGDTETSIDIVNDKIKLLKGNSENLINLKSYINYFNFLEKLGLREDFDIITTEGNLLLCGSIIRPILINDNNSKLLIFCHGVTN